MSWKIWKKAGERANEEYTKALEKGVNLKDWDTAVSCFKKAQELFSKENMGEEAAKAGAQMYLYSAYTAHDASKARLLLKASELFARFGEEQIERLGQASNLVTELQGWTYQFRSESGEGTEKVQFLSKAVESFSQLKDKELILAPELIRSTTTAQRQALVLDGRRNILEGEGLEEADPTHAISSYTNALSSFRAARDEQSAELVRARISQLSMRRVCWFCGRETQGKNLHFSYMKTEAGPYFQSLLAKVKEDPNLLSEDSVSVCRVCGSTVEIASDEIARQHADAVREELRAAVESLQDSIATLSDELSALSGRVSSM